MMSDTRQWHVAVDQVQEGPFDTATVEQGFASGKWALAAALVWTDSFADWTPARDVPVFQKAAAAAAAHRAPPPNPVTSEAPAPAGSPRASSSSSSASSSSSSSSKRSHVVDFKIEGEEMQFVEVELDAGETVIAEAGVMMYMTPSIEMETKFGDGSAADAGGGFLGKALSAGKRMLTGESLFMTHFTAKAGGKSHVAFAAPYPGRIIALDLSQLGGEILCERDAFLCAAKGTEVGIAFNKKFGAGLFGGEGFILQRLRGDGMAFVHSGGTVVQRDLAPREMLRVDTGCIVAFQPGVAYDIQMVKGLKSAFFGGEGLFFATLTGPGRVWLQSLPFSRLARRVMAAAAPAANKGEGGILNAVGGLGNILGGD
jgi:uncharacterized protein (TIGR00266 family)